MAEESWKFFVSYFEIFLYAIFDNIIVTKYTSIRRNILHKIVNSKLIYETIREILREFWKF